MTEGSGYKVCEECGVRYSTLTRHKCFRPEEQKDPPKHEGKHPGDGGDEEGEPEQGEGEGDPREGEGEGGGTPPPPPPEEITAVEMVTLLRFAALSAEAALAFITAEISVDGIVLIGRDGEKGRPVIRVIKWEDLAKVETKLAEDNILEAIKGIDYEVEGDPTEVDPLMWLPWSGGTMPVERGTRVDIRRRDGIEKLGVKAGAFMGAAGGTRWLHADPGRDEEIVAYRVSVEQTEEPEKADDGWIEWKASDMDVPPDGVLPAHMTEVRLRDGEELTGGLARRADDWSWSTCGGGTIVAYRLTGETDVVVEADGWVEWTDADAEAHDFPLDLNADDMVQIRCRDGHDREAHKAGGWWWGRDGGSNGEITHYRIVT